MAVMLHARYTLEHVANLTSDERVDTKTVDKVVISLFRAGKELGDQVELGVDLAC